MSKYIFNSLIKCGICKEKNYKGIQERKKNKYICQNYQYKKCQRNIIEEDILIKFFKIYCDKNKILWQPEARKYIDKIIALGNSSFEIYYKNGGIQFYKENIIKFI